MKSHDADADVAILDFSETFDIVPHNKSLHKLNIYKGSLNKWLKIFLTHTKTKDVIYGEDSE